MTRPAVLWKNKTVSFLTKIKLYKWPVLSQPIYALRLLQTRGSNNAALQQVYQPTVSCRSSDVRRQCMTRSHQCIRSPAHQLSDRPLSTSRILFASSLNVWRIVLRWRWQTVWQSHHPLRRNATSSDSVDARYSCRNTQHTYQTATSLHSCMATGVYIRFMIKWDWFAFSRL